MVSYLRSVFDLWERVSNREDLIQELKEHRWMLSEELYEYFLKLFDFYQYSVFDDALGMDYSKRKNFSGLDIYRKLAIYNIYHHALEIFDKNAEKYSIVIGGNDRGIEGLQVDGILSDKSFKIFDYSYSMAVNVFDRMVVPDGCKIDKIGDVHLFSTSVLDKHGDQLTDFERERANIQQYFSQLLLSSYGIHGENDFSSSIVNNNVKTLTKKYPGGSIHQHIRYI